MSKKNVSTPSAISTNDDPRIYERSHGVTAKLLRARALVHMIQEATTDRFNDGDPMMATMTEVSEMALELLDAAYEENGEIQQLLLERQGREHFFKKADAWDRAQASPAVRKAFAELDKAIEAGDKDWQRVANARVQYELSKFESMQLEALEAGKP